MIQLQLPKKGIASQWGHGIKKAMLNPNGASLRLKWNRQSNLFPFSSRRPWPRIPSFPPQNLYMYNIYQWPCCPSPSLLIHPKELMRTSWVRPNLFLVPILLFFPYSHSCTFTITNNCPQTIWPGTLAGAGTPQLATTGFQLDAGQSVRIPESVPGWSGRIWARTGCVFDESGVGSCQTGDCGGRLECAGNGATPPASLFEVTLGKGSDKDFYDVSIVDGYNLPLIAAPMGVYGGGCNATGCASDINIGCPKELQVVEGGNDEEEGGGVVACKSACEAFGLDQYCCSGEFANPTTCQPSFYSTIFKRACPRAYSYAFDDYTSIFTCKAYDYAIIFCPNVNGTKRSNGVYTPASFQEHKQGDIANMVSSTDVIHPFPLAILLIFNIFLLIILHGLISMPRVVGVSRWE